MVDPTQPPPPSFSPIGQPLRSGSAVGNIISQIPSSILALSQGSILTGLLTAKQPQVPGGFLFQTPQGTLSLVTQLPLEVGSKLSLEVLGRGAEFHARLLTVDGKAPPVGSRDTVLRTLPPQATSSAATFSLPNEAAVKAPPTPLLQNDDAHIFRLSQTIAQQITSGKFPLSSPTSVYSDEATTVQTQTSAGQLRVFPAVLLTPEPKGISELITAKPALLAPPPSLTSFFLPPVASPTHIGAGSIIQLAVQQVTVPPHLAVSLTAEDVPVLPSSEPVIKGVVVGVEKSGETVVHTQIGTIKLTLDRPLPQSTEISFIPLSITSYNPASQGAQTAEHDALGNLLSHWKALTDTEETVRQQLPENLRDAFIKALPNADHALGSKLLRFIQMVNSEKPEHFFPKEVIRHLEDKAPELLQQLRHDISHIKQAFSQESHKLWQMLLFPVFDGQEFHQVQFYLHDYYEDGNAKQEEPDGTRFVVELSTERFGAMQFDGLVRKRKPRTAFDLVIRTHMPLPEEMRADIRGIFMGALEDSQLQGSLVFQRVPAFPVHPSQEFFAQEGKGGMPSEGSILV
jgi:hypothetical protein